MDESLQRAQRACRRRTVLRGVTGVVAATTAVGPVVAQSQSYEPLGSVAVRGGKEVVVGENDTVYVAATDGFAVVDVSDPTAPTVLAERRDILANQDGGPLADIYDVKVDGNRLLVAGPSHGGAFRAIVVYDVSDPADPERVNWRTTEMYHHNVFVRDDVVYLTGNGIAGHPLVMVDAGTLEELGRWSVTEEEPGWSDVDPYLWPLHDVWVQDSVAYLVYWDAGTWILDVDDPANPAPITKVGGRQPSALTDLTGAEVRAEGLQTPGNHHYATVNDDSTLLGINAEAWDVDPADDRGSPGGIELFDISSPTEPTSLARIESPPTDNPTYDGTWTTAHNFEISGDRLYTSWYAGGVRLFDVNDPANPREVRAWRDSETTSFWTAQSARPGEFFVASSRKNPSAGDGARLYTFPEPPLGSGPGGSPPATNTTTGNGPTTTATETATGTPTPTGTTDTTPAQGTDASGPGFGVVTGLVGFGLGAWRYLQG